MWFAAGFVSGLVVGIAITFVGIVALAIFWGSDEDRGPATGMYE